MKSDSRISGIDLNLFRHSVYGRVKTFEVDRQNIVHNVIYLYWLEHARVEYVRSLGILINATTFIDHHTFVVAKTEINYFAPALFDQEYTVLTRIPSIGNSSFVFEQIILLTESSTILVSAQSVLVQLHPETKLSEPISDDFRKKVMAYESANI